MGSKTGRQQLKEEAALRQRGLLLRACASKFELLLRQGARSTKRCWEIIKRKKQFPTHFFLSLCFQKDKFSFRVHTRVYSSQHGVEHAIRKGPFPSLVLEAQKGIEHRTRALYSIKNRLKRREKTLRQKPTIKGQLFVLRAHPSHKKQTSGKNNSQHYLLTATTASFRLPPPPQHIYKPTWAA